MHARGNNIYGQQPYAAQSAYGNKLGSAYPDASLGGSDMGSQLAGKSRHPTMSTRSQDSDIGGYRAATPHSSGQYDSVYGSSVLIGAQQFDESLGHGTYLHELVHCYRADWVKDDNKYGQYESINPSSFQNQIYEGPDTDIETEIHLAQLRHGRLDNPCEDEPGSTSSRKHKDASFNTLLNTKNLGESPLPAYDPAFDWENERSMIFGQRLPEIHPLFYDRGLKICVKVHSLSFQAGLVEPFHGTMCLFDKERRERLSEDFFFRILPHESQDVWSSFQQQAIFHLDAPSSSVCLLVKLERSATEESGVTSSVYSRKDPANLTEREKQKLQLWSQIMPYREAFAWAMVPLFDNCNNAAFGGYGSPGGSITSPMSVSSFHDGVSWNSSKIALNGNSCWTHSNSTIIDVSNFNKVKESYTEDSLNDPKRKVHKPVKGALKLEIDKIQSDNADLENHSENGSVINDSNDPTDQLDLTNVKFPNKDPVESHNTNSWRNTQGRKQTVGNGTKELGSIGNENVHIFDYHTIMRNEPFAQLLHFLYVYPLTVSLSHKKNLFIRVELRSDDKDVPKEPLKAVYPREPGTVIQKWVHTQVSIGTRLACYHDEIKLCLPIIWTPSHHILFTFFHIDLQTKNDPPKPVVVGYATLPLATISQHLSEISLPIMRDLLPHYLQDVNKDRVDYFEEGKLLFRLRLRLCSSLFPFNERIRDFFCEYDQHSFHTGPPWGSELLEAINNLKNVESLTLIQFLHPLLNMLLHLISSSGETLQVAAFRAMVNILTRVQQESVDDTERNAFLSSYVDYIFDDFGGRQLPVYHGLSTVWGSLARSKAKGYRVGPVYDDVLAMAWFFLELIAKSMALEKIYIFHQSMLASEDIPPLQLKEGVFRCIMQLYDCLLSEVHERLKKGLILAKRLNSSLAYFCYDLLSVVEPRQVFELISLYLDRFAGLCIPSLHDCKLTFLQIICDHDLFVEMPGRDPSERNYLSSILIQELFLTCDHDDLPQRSKATRIIVIILCKHEFDIRYQKDEDKLYISQLYFPFIGQILDEIHIFYNLNVVEKREVLIAALQILRNLDEVLLINMWKLSIARTRLFFKLLEECLNLFEHKKPIDSMLIGSSSRTLGSAKPTSPRYTDRLSPAINIYLSEAARQEVVPHGTSENSSLWQRVITSPNQPYSLREALAQAQSSRIGASMHSLRESLHPVLRQKLELWEENLSASVSLQVLEIMEKFSRFAASSNMIATDVGKLDCITVILMSLMSRSQPLDFWKAFLPIFNEIFNLHGVTLMSRENDRFLKQMAFHLLRLAVFRNDNIRERAVIGLQILVRSSSHFRQMARLRAMLIITLSELMSDMHVTQMRPDGTLEESSESCRLRLSLEEVADEMGSSRRLKSCGLPEDALVEVPENDRQRMWSWKEAKFLSNSLLMALAATLEHTIMVSMVNTDRYAVAESFYKLAIAFSPVPDLHIMWLLHLCDAHQEMQCWAEAAQCAVSVAGVVMQALVSRNEGIWSKDHLSALRNICPAVNIETTSETSAAEVEGYGASKLTVDSAVKYLQLANKLFSQAELYHFCATIIELIIPVYKSRRSYGQLANCHTLLTNIYESILEQEASPIPFADATYYRVGFYGSHFGKLDRKEYLYREPPDVRLGDIMKKLSHIYEPKPGSNSQPLQIIPDSRRVNAEELETGVRHLQITAVDPVMEDDDLGSRRDSRTGSRVRVVFDSFLFDTPFTKNGRSQGGLEDQWKRRSVVKTEGSFPALVNRLVVVKSECMEFSPVENAIGMIEARTCALRNELEEPRHSDGDHHPPRLHGLQRILQGSVAVQVNSGVLGVCTAFLSGEPATRLRSQELQQLIAALLEFMAVCKRAIKVHLRLIGEEDEEFHTQLVNGFQSLTAELSHYIPAILSEL